jgi:hypothetical protein
LKLQRLGRLIDELRELQGGSDSLHPTAISIRTDPNIGRYVVLDEPPRLPPEWSLVFADAVHNARCSLDHLAFDLARAHEELDERSQGQISYPIFRTENGFTRWVDRINAATRFDAEVLQRFRELQPWNAANGDIWRDELRLFASHHAVYVSLVTDLDNINKHRFVVPMWLGVKVTDPFAIPGLVMLDWVGAVGPGKQLAIIRGDETPEVDTADFDVEPYIGEALPYVEGADFGLRPPPAAELLNRFGHVCMQLLLGFEPALAGGAPLSCEQIVKAVCGAG